MLDLDAPHVSVVECPACHQPAAAKEACATCGAAVEIPECPIATEPTSEDPPLVFDLRKLPPGVRDPGKRPRAADIEPLRRPWEEAIATLAGPHTLDDEFRATWLGASLARLYAGTGDAVRERAALETALSRVSNAGYRALLLARLARAAVVTGRFALAVRWLDDCILRPGSAEVESDVAVARALLLIRTDRPGEVLSLLGPSDEGLFIGPARILADLIRIDALEKMGDHFRAFTLYYQAILVHGAAPLQDLVFYYGVAASSRRLILVTGLGTLVALIGFLAYMLIAMRGLR